MTEGVKGNKMPSIGKVEPAKSQIKSDYNAN